MLRATSHLNRAIRRILAGATLVAQVLLVAAPLVDVHPPVVETSVLQQGLHSASLTVPLGDAAPQHDATRCPGCIAQSIHASPVAGAVTPIRLVEHQIAAESGAAVAATFRTPSAHHSRAPPRIG